MKKCALLLLLPILFSSCSGSAVREYESRIAELEEKIFILENTNASYAERAVKAESASKQAEEDVTSLKLTYLKEITDLRKQVQTLSSDLEAKEAEVLSLTEQLSAPSTPAIIQNSDTVSSVKFTEGQYKIGSDMPAGEYLFIPSKRGDSGYFCCSSDANGDDIINNDNFDSFSIYKVQSGEYLKLNDCYAVPLSDAQIPTTDYTDGTYIVGTHISAGEYKVASTTEGRSGYYCVYSNLYRDDIVSNDYFEGSVYVSLSEGDVIVLDRCRIIAD